MERARLARLIGRDKEALGAVNKAIGLSPENVEFLRLKAGVLASLRNPRGVVEVCDRLLEVDPRDAEALREKAVALEQLGDPEAALLTFDAALRTDPMDRRTWNAKGSLLAGQGRLPEALGAFDHCLSLNPGDRFALVQSGGGGYGHPAERDPMLVLHDVEDELITLEEARDAYGVAMRREGWKFWRSTLALLARTTCRPSSSSFWPPRPWCCAP